MLLRASAPFFSSTNAGTGGDRFLVPGCTLKAISPATPLQLLPHLAPGVVFGVAIFAFEVKTKKRKSNNINDNAPLGIYPAA